ncbi:MAG: hypothetical protein WC227_04155 [Patescibacteria group bacterium]
MVVPETAEGVFFATNNLVESLETNFTLAKLFPKSMAMRFRDSIPQWFLRKNSTVFRQFWMAVTRELLYH